MSDDVRTRLIEAAGPIFAEKGFQAATVREICQAASANIASVNYYFGDKQRLYVETVKHAHCVASDRIPLPDWSPDVPAVQRLRDFVRTTVARIAGQRQAYWQMQLMMREIASGGEAAREVFEEFVRPHFTMGVSLFDALLPDGTPEAVKQRLMFSLVGQCLFYKLAGDTVGLLVGPDAARQDYTLEKIADHIIGVTLAAAGLGPPLGGPAGETPPANSTQSRPPAAPEISADATTDSAETAPRRT